MQLLKKRLIQLSARKTESTFDEKEFDTATMLFQLLLIDADEFLKYRLDQNSRQENCGRILGIPETARRYLIEKGISNSPQPGFEYLLSMAAFVRSDERCSDLRLRGKDLGLTEIVRFANSRKLNICEAISCYSWEHADYGFIDPMIDLFFIDMFEQQAPYLLERAMVV